MEHCGKNGPRPKGNDPTARNFLLGLMCIGKKMRGPKSGESGGLIEELHTEHNGRIEAFMSKKEEKMHFSHS